MHKAILNDPPIIHINNTATLIPDLLIHRFTLRGGFYAAARLLPDSHQKCHIVLSYCAVARDAFNVLVILKETNPH